MRMQKFILLTEAPDDEITLFLARLARSLGEGLTGTTNEELQRAVHKEVSAAIASVSAGVGGEVRNGDVLLPYPEVYLREERVLADFGDIRAVKVKYEDFGCNIHIAVLSYSVVLRVLWTRTKRSTAMLVSVCPSKVGGKGKAGEGKERRKVWGCIRWGEGELGDIRVLKGGDLRFDGVGLNGMKRERGRRSFMNRALSLELFGENRQRGGWRG